MCTILAANQIHPDYPLLIAANRDEFLTRTALPPHEIQPGVFAGTDLEKGGSWMGATRTGLFVGLTNQHTQQPLAPAPLSRGEIVVNALSTGSLEEALRYLRDLDPTRYNPFNLLLGDPSRLFVAYSWKTPRVEPIALPPGLHILANDELGSPLYPKTLRAEHLTVPLLQSPWKEFLPAIQIVLADHHLPPPSHDLPLCDEILRPVARDLQALCVHTKYTYGTSSSSVIAISTIALAHYAFAEGSPCSAPLREILLSR